MAIYMKIDGMSGNVTAKGYANWIELEAFDFDIQRKLNTQPGRVANREGSKPVVSEVEITKRLDKSSSLLFGEATVGTAKPQTMIHFVTTGVSPKPYLEYTLYNVIVSRHKITCNSSGQANNAEQGSYPLEKINLNFDKIEMKVTPFDKDNKPLSPIPAGYDLNEAVAT